MLMVVPGVEPDRAADATEPLYDVVLSTDPAEIEAAQRLRYQIFAEEMGAPLPYAVRGPLTGEMIDADKLDPHCDHLLVRDERTGQIVGCCRLLPPAGYAAAGQTFTDSMFDASALDGLRPKLIELGRVSVAREHRSGAVMGMIWAGILRYQQSAGHQWAIGCLSVRMEDGGPRGSLVRGVHDFAQRFAAPEQYRVMPRNPVVVNGVPLDDIRPPQRPRIPPLLHGCMRIGGRICGPPSYDPDFDMADFLVLISRDMVRGRYLEWLERSHALR